VTKAEIEAADAAFLAEVDPRLRHVAPGLLAEARARLTPIRMAARFDRRDGMLRRVATFAGIAIEIGLIFPEWPEARRLPVARALAEARDLRPLAPGEHVTRAEVEAADLALRSRVRS
jgi:hypothetical protein